MGRSSWNNGSKCLICLKDIGLSCCSPDKAKCDDSVELLYQIAKILKVSATIYNNIELDSLPGQLLCFTCNLKIFDAVRLQQELGVIADKLDKLSDEIKNDFAKSCSLEISKDGYSVENELIPVERIRRAYGQCWTQCKIDLKRCRSDHPLLKRSRVKGRSFPRPKLPNLQFAEWDGFHEGILDYTTLLDFEDESLMYSDSRDLCEEFFFEGISENRNGLKSTVEGDAFLCHFCGEVAREKFELQVHLLNVHQFVDNISNYENSKEDEIGTVVFDESNMEDDEIVKEGDAEIIPDSTCEEKMRAPAAVVGQEHRCRKEKKSKKRSGRDETRAKDLKRKSKKCADTSTCSASKSSKVILPVIVQHSISSINNNSHLKTSRRNSSSKSVPPETKTKSKRKEQKRHPINLPGEGELRSKKTPGVSRSIVCPICGRNLSRKSDMQRHMKEMHHLPSSSRIPW